ATMSAIRHPCLIMGQCPSNFEGRNTYSETEGIFSGTDCADHRHVDTEVEGTHVIRIANRPIGIDHAPFIVAEMSGNHNQSLDRALAIVDAAARTGAHAIKLQTYTADTMTLDLAEGMFFIDEPDSLWKGRSLYELYQEAYTPWEWHAPIFERARELGLIAFSTPFDETAVDFLEKLDVPCYKIASFENTDLPLIRKVAATGKPMLISTGMANLAELDETVRTARESGCKDLVLLKCTSTYPATPENSHARTIPHMRQLFDCEVGLSDHTLGVGTAVAAAALGAAVLEKHFTLKRADGGVDSAFSLEPEELAALVVESARAWRSLGAVTYGASEEERKSRIFRRSLYIVEDMAAGDVLTPENLRCIRPGLGLAPKYYDVLLGKRVSRNVRRGTPVNWGLV
ncbi:MAG: N-acetylneuraminate synthase, partial [Candidatus Kentron sp. G]